MFCLLDIWLRSGVLQFAVQPADRRAVCMLGRDGQKGGGKGTVEMQPSRGNAPLFFFNCWMSGRVLALLPAVSPAGLERKGRGLCVGRRRKFSGDPPRAEMLDADGTSPSNDIGRTAMRQVRVRSAETCLAGADGKPKSAWLGPAVSRVGYLPTVLPFPPDHAGRLRSGDLRCHCLLVRLGSIMKLIVFFLLMQRRHQPSIG